MNSMDSREDATAGSVSVAVIEREVAMLLRLAELAQPVPNAADVLPRSAYLLLLELDSAGPLGVAALADALQLDISTVSRQISPLEKRKLLKRLSNPSDARSSLLEITEAGREQLRFTRERRYALYTALLEGWQEEERAHFASLLARLNAAISERIRQRTHGGESGS